jgi:hypothetical protein
VTVASLACFGCCWAAVYFALKEQSWFGWRVLIFGMTALALLIVYVRGMTQIAKAIRNRK